MRNKYFITTIIVFIMTTSLLAQGAGNALDLDGVNDYIQVSSSTGDELNPSNAVTVECWVYIQETISTTHRPHLIVKGYSYGLIIETNGHPKFYINDGSWRSVEGVTTLNLNTWYHVAGVYDNTNNIFTIYLNGVQENSDATDYGTLAQNANDVELGTFTIDNNNYANAIIDEIRIWSEARSETQLRTYMCRKLTGSETNLEGYWRLDETSGTTAADLTSNSNDGTLTNMSGNEWTTSGAALGDESAYSYPASWAGETVTLSHNDGDNFGISNVAGTPDGIHIYRVDEVPNITTPPGTWDKLDPLRYWGVFIVGGTSPTYSLAYTYTGHPGIVTEDDLALAVRDDNSDNSWADAGATLTTSSDLLSITNQTAGEYILGSLTSDNPLPVELTSFTATAGDETVILNWETASELNNMGYIIYRSMSKNTDYEEINSYKYNENLKSEGTVSNKTIYEYIDRQVVNGQTYWYKIADVDINGNKVFHGPISMMPIKSAVDKVGANIPFEWSLSQNYPNPFNPTTKIAFNIPSLKNSMIDIKLFIYNVLGEKVKTLYNGSISHGRYEIEWNGRDDNGSILPSGVYIYQLISANYNKTKKMVLTK